jgi:hypothetical protein
VQFTLVLEQPLLDAQHPFTSWLPETDLGFSIPILGLVLLVIVVSSYVFLLASAAAP